MPEQQSVVLAVSNDHRSRVHPPAEYFGKRAEQCLLLADEASDADAATMLRRLATAFQSRARSLGQ